MKAFHILVALGCIFLSGCTKENDELSIDLGVYEDGMPFWDWKGMLYRVTSVNGKVTFPTGSKAEANFENNKVIISVLSMLTEDEVYSVNGSYTSTEPFTLNLLGAGSVKGIELKLYEGSGLIDYSGTLEATYTKPNTNHTE